LTLADGSSVNFPMDGFARYCLLQGIDQLGYLRNMSAAIASFEESRTWTP
jgi:3-isopropylmalate/(R)-2-methylmalate dehydratase small subunit